MQSKKLSMVACILVAAVITMPSLSSSVWAQDSGTSLDRAVRLFEQGDYLSAQEVLAGLDRSGLSAEQQSLRDDYLTRTQTALQQHEKALRDLEDAETAADSNEPGRARDLASGILANQYAPSSVRDAASALLRRLGDVQVADAQAESGQEPAEHGADPAKMETARTLTEQGNAALTGGRYDEAEDLFQEALQSVSGYPDAVDGLRQVALHQQDIEGSRAGQLIEQIRRQDAIQWQRTVAKYRDAESQVHAQVGSQQFDDANQSLVRARQIVDAGRQFADPPAKYESLSNELEALAVWVSNQEREYHTLKVEQTRRQIEDQRKARLRQDRENRRRQVDALMEQAMQHRKDGDFDSAIAVLQQVIIIDAHYDPARWMMDDLEEINAYRENRMIREEFYRQTRSALIEVERSKIPWHQELLYPNDWPEISARRQGGAGSASSLDSRLFAVLDKPVRVDFNDEPLEEVVAFLAKSHQLNIVVNWADLKLAGVDASTKIDLYLPAEISLKRALTEVLQRAGGTDAELGFDVREGVLKIATRATLDQDTYTVVYDINDLLMEIPNFTDAPLQSGVNYDVSPRASKDAPSARWSSGDVEVEEQEQDPVRARRLKQIIDLIQSTVAPHTWRSLGGTSGSISEINGQLVITQNSASQFKVGDLLGSLREQRAVQIAIEARFITISSHFLEELGVDIDLVLNNGNAGFDFVQGAGGSAATDPVLGSALLLPRTFSRLGFSQVVPGLGAPLTQGAAIGQPFTNASLVPLTAGGGGSQLTPVPITSRASNFTSPSNIGSDVAGSFAGTQLGPAFSLFGSFLDNIQVDFLLRATQADSRTTVMTAPQLVLFNGQRSWVAVAVNQSFVSQLNPVVAQGAVAQAPQIGSVSTGAALDVQSTVTADRRYVTMTLRPSLSRLLDLQTIPFSGGAAGGGFGGNGAALPAFVQLPTIAQQRASTTVSVPDGGTLLLGGQKVASETEVEAGVPVLSKIPLLKRAYSSRTVIKDEQTLLILVKPKIMIQSEQEELAFPGFGRR